MIKINLVKKRILYVISSCLQYDYLLANKLRSLGSTVDTFELSITGFPFRFIKKFTPQKAQKFAEEYYEKILIGKDYDFVLVRGGQQLSDKLYENLKSSNPNARFINFHWDSMKKQYNYESVIKYFDKIYSFDYEDCQNNNKVNYLSLFCIDEYLNDQSNNSNTEFDLLFIGAWRNEERVQLIASTEKLCQQLDLKFHHHLYSRLWEQFWLIRTGRKPTYAKSRLLSHKEILKLFSISNTIIDFPSSFQTGLTMRTFEALGAGKKLITTNQNIINEPFYDPEFISILNTEDFNLDRDFIKNVPRTIIKDKMKEYSLENYIYKLLQN